MRFHPVDLALSNFAPMIPLLVVGADGRVIALFGLVSAVHGLFQHANLVLRLGPLNWIFSMAELHRWHHSRNLEESNTNFGQNLIVWDIVFGTRFLPKDREPPEDIGIAGLPAFPMDYWGQLPVALPMAPDPQGERSDRRGRRSSRNASRQRIEPAARRAFAARAGSVDVARAVRERANPSARLLGPALDGPRAQDRVIDLQRIPVGESLPRFFPGLEVTHRTEGVRADEILWTRLRAALGIGVEVDLDDLVVRPGHVEIAEPAASAARAWSSDQPTSQSGGCGFWCGLGTTSIGRTSKRAEPQEKVGVSHMSTIIR